MKYVVGTLTAIALAVFAAIVITGVRERNDEQPSAPPQTVDSTEQITRGRYLALAGNCAGCHTARGGAAYAGGRAVETPFGNVYASNITPDVQSGLGNWSADDFWRALHLGKSKNGKLLYPAFPYPNYTRVTRADSDALFAYLRTLAPVNQANREHDLRFPYNNRWLLVGWRTLYFSPGVYKTNTQHDDEWNRGAYLVQGLGHCNACHTGRDVLGGSNLKADLAGGMIPMLNWYAPSLTSDLEAGLGDWQVGHIVELMKTGTGRRGAVYGPMAEVVYKSMQHLTGADAKAIAVYLKSLPQTHPPSDGGGTSFDQAEIERTMIAGAHLYEKHCADCHGKNGAGQPPAYPPLAGNRSLTMRPAVNSIRMVLNGGFAPGTAGNPRPYGMPPFRPLFTDEDIAAVVSYVRNSWGNKAGYVSPVEVDRFRSAPLD